jgi:hypothetical protein
MLRVISPVPSTVSLCARPPGAPSKHDACKHADSDTHPLAMPRPQATNLVTSQRTTMTNRRQAQVGSRMRSAAATPAAQPPARVAATFCSSAGPAGTSAQERLGDFNRTFNRPASTNHQPSWLSAGEAPPPALRSVEAAVGCRDSHPGTRAPGRTARCQLSDRRRGGDWPREGGTPEDRADPTLGGDKDARLEVGAVAIGLGL